MITLITATPGAGKTLYAVTLIDAALKSGRVVYSNIAGLVLDKFGDTSNLHSAPADWRDCDDGALIIYDEAQETFPATAKAGIVGDDRLTAMETHRHRGIDLVFITQNPTFLHHHIRKLAGEHIHLYRGRGLNRVARYSWSHAVTSPNDRFEQRRADMSVWKLPKRFFGYYTSAVLHTHKLKLPFKVTLMFIFIFIALVTISLRLWSSGGLAIFSGLGG